MNIIHQEYLILKIYHQISSYNTNTATLHPSSVASNTITCVVTTTILSCLKSYYDNSNPTSYNIKLESESSQILILFSAYKSFAK
jgi:hypothetical protein